MTEYSLVFFYIATPLSLFAIAVAIYLSGQSHITTLSNQPDSHDSPGVMPGKSSVVKNLPTMVAVKPSLDIPLNIERTSDASISADTKTSTAVDASVLRNLRGNKSTSVLSAEEKTDTSEVF